MADNSQEIITMTGVPAWLQPPKVDTYPMYTEWTWESILQRLSGGESLRSILRDDPTMPDIKEYCRLLNWIHSDVDRHNRYVEAQKIGAEALVEKMVDVADGLDNPIEDVQRSKLRVDTYKWLISVRNRDRYGDKRQIEQTVNVNISDAMEKAELRVIEGMRIE